MNSAHPNLLCFGLYCPETERPRRRVSSNPEKWEVVGKEQGWFQCCLGNPLLRRGLDRAHRLQQCRLWWCHPASWHCPFLCRSAGRGESSEWSRDLRTRANPLFRGRGAGWATFTGPPSLALFPLPSKTRVPLPMGPGTQCGLSWLWGQPDSWRWFSSIPLEPVMQ